MEPFQFPIVTSANCYCIITWTEQYYLYRVGIGILAWSLDCPSIDNTFHSVSRILEVEASKVKPFPQRVVHHLAFHSSLRRINGCLQEDPTSRR